MFVTRLSVGGGGGVVTVPIFTDRALMYPPWARPLTETRESHCPLLSLAVMVASLGIDPITSSPAGMERMGVRSVVMPETRGMGFSVSDDKRLCVPLAELKTDVSNLGDGGWMLPAKTQNDKRGEAACRLR